MSANCHIHGIHETEVVSEGGEGELLSSFDNCSKNPGHQAFIPINDLTVDHLPENFKDNDICEYMHSVADLTARVSVNTTSYDRPEFWAETDISYPFFATRGSSVFRFGSAMVRRVTKHTDQDSYPETCKCNMCLTSSTPSTVWVELDVYTATHVVFNAEETQSVNLKFFFNDYKNPSVNFDRTDFVRADVNEDLTWLKCYTCDKTLVERLSSVWERFLASRTVVCDRYESEMETYKLTFIVSHPHGCSKMVTIGHWKERILVRDRLTKYTYDTGTCNGSSGASVNILGYNTGKWFYRQHVHCGVFQDLQLNYSSTGLD
ncbi:uncharacterized protein LOC106071891 [Biomphalaria glabrata]|uniref:Uncharacterized protein LOC106071891 n=1 Tax=Biomphalaria glabrata TaxID=6526 RepID=A0A9W2ZEH4_BIOGL|nr:uncharacterized protein LOC106071891 [Biomphalaria glabrata]XP_055873367.1 uncharacterized protein LOC106071891 [Biomphalaria glabrata]KAI8785472.1 hypothetical protein BgiBS90_012830 [Biomphalaria glabrata]